MSENKMEQVSQMLGVELGEEFSVTGQGGIFRISKELGVEHRNDYTGEWEPTAVILRDILLGNAKVKKLWKPKMGEEFFISSSSDKDGWEVFVWADNVEDRFWYDNGLVFRTEEEASEMTGKILAFIRKERGIE